MIKLEDWGQLYYAVIKREDISNQVMVLGVGSTLFSARQNAIKYISQIKFKKSISIQTHTDSILACELNTYIRPNHNISQYKIGIVYAEAKVKIYGERYGYEGMVVVFDPTYKEDLLRFVGYDKKEKQRLENARRKYEL